MSLITELWGLSIFGLSITGVCPSLVINVLSFGGKIFVKFLKGFFVCQGFLGAC